VRAAVQTGGVRLVFASADPRSSSADAAAWSAAVEEQGEGLCGLVLGVADLGAATAALGPLAPPPDGGALKLDPASCHGIPITIR
jgi:hypothetical protein